jgi:hypothetical protein
MTIGATILAAVFCGISVPFFILFGKDVRRLREGARFRAGRESPSDGAFLEIFTKTEIEGLEAPRLRWVSKSLPDPRDIHVSSADARIYWRVALARYQSSQMKSELALVLLSGVLGVVIASLIGAVARVGLAVDPQEIILFFGSIIIVFAAAFAIATKVAVGRRWQEAIDLYHRIGWPPVVEPAKRTLLQRLLRRF